MKKTHKWKIAAALAAAALLFLVSGCSGGDPEAKQEKQFFAMDTDISLVAYGEHGEEGVAAAEEEVKRLDQMLTTGSADSEVGAINAAGGGKLSKEGAYLMRRALAFHKETDGAFDVAIYPLMEAWGFTTKKYRVPSEGELAELRKRIEAKDIAFDEKKRSVSFATPGMKIDFGGIAKGYASDRVIEVLKKKGVKNAIVNLGGNVYTLGGKPDGSAWNVAIEDPGKDGYLGVVQIKDGALITSGGYERYFEEGGTRYHHIIDPSTGKPANNGLVSVSIVSKDGTMADAMSTSMFILGEEKALAFWRKHSDDFQMVLLTEDGRLLATEGLKESMTSERYEITFVR